LSFNTRQAATRTAARPKCSAQAPNETSAANPLLTRPNPHAVHPQNDGRPDSPDPRKRQELRFARLGFDEVLWISGRPIDLVKPAGHEGDTTMAEGRSMTAREADLPLGLP
jgi:hypothetical protein